MYATINHRRRQTILHEVLINRYCRGFCHLELSSVSLEQKQLHPHKSQDAAIRKNTYFETLDKKINKKPSRLIYSDNR